MRASNGPIENYNNVFIKWTLNRRFCLFKVRCYILDFSSIFLQFYSGFLVMSIAIILKFCPEHKSVSVPSQSWVEMKIVASTWLNRVFPSATFRIAHIHTERMHLIRGYLSLSCDGCLVYSSKWFLLTQTNVDLFGRWADFLELGVCTSLYWS